MLHLSNDECTLWKGSGSRIAVAEGARRDSECRDLTAGSIRGWPEAPNEARGLARIVAQARQIALLPGVPTRYPPRMVRDDTTPRPAPAGWLENLERSEADLEAGRTVLLEPVLARMRESIKRLEARQAGQDAEAAQQE